MRLWSLVAVSALILVAGVWAWCAITDRAELGTIGTFGSAVVATLALLWLVAGYQLQGDELRLQRQELSLQRKAIEVQGAEMRNVSAQAALSQVHSIVIGFNTMVGQMRVSQVDSIYDIPRALLPAMALFRGVLQGATPQVRYDAYRQWSAVEGLGLQLLAAVAACIRLYAQHAPTLTLAPDLSDEELVVQNSDALQSVPHVQVIAGPAITVAQLFLQQRPQLLRVRLSGFEATNAVIPGLIREERLNELWARVEALAQRE